MKGIPHNLMGNASNNSQSDINCGNDLYPIFIGISDAFSIFVGQPVLARLLWVAFHSKKTDILNINLALFHNFQYLLTTIHLCMFYFYPEFELRMVLFTFVYILIGGPMNLSFICLERYIAVIHPTSYPLLTKFRCREVCALSVWIVALPLALIKSIPTELIGGSGWAIDAVEFCVLGLLLIILIWTNVAIVKALRTSGPSTKLHPAKKRAFKTVCAIAIIALLCYIPVGGCILLTVVVGPKLNCSTVPIILMLVSIASVVHPLFYLSAIGKLQCLGSSASQ